MANFNPMCKTKLGFKVWLLDFVTATLVKAGEKRIISYNLTTMYFGCHITSHKNTVIARTRKKHGRLIGEPPLTFLSFSLLAKPMLSRLFIFYKYSEMVTP